MLIRHLRRLAFILLAVVPAAMYGQDSRGTILGLVADETGAVIPGADIRVTNSATGVSASAKTNQSGRYVLPYLIPGTYELVVEQKGFKKAVQDNIQVRINDSVEVNVSLQVGQVSESVNVTAETPLLSTAESSLGQVIDERRVLQLPLFAGNAMDLVHLAPGTVNGTNLRLRKAPFNSAPSQFSTDGGGNNNNEFSIDGVSNTFSDGTAPRVAFSPPQTAIGEFKIQTSAFDASLGHTLGSMVNVSTKSGTNELHGEAHWWVRNAAFDTKTIFQNRASQKLPIYQDNRYGVSAGAPITIPGLYNGKNRTFWFWAWEANKFGDPNVGQATSTVPTEAMRRGDLSALLALGPQYQIYDPLTTRAVEGGRFVRSPFINNIIPANRLDPLGQKILSYYPLPNQQGTSDFRNNYFNSGKALEDYWVHLGRFDHAFSDKHRMFVRIHRDYWEEDKNRNFPNNVNGVILNRINRGIALDDVYMFSPSFLLNFRYGLTQQEFPERRVSRGFDLSTLGFSDSVLSQVDKSVAVFPRVQVGSLSALSNWESGDGTTASLTHSFVGNFTRLAGSHNVRFGPEYRVYREFRNRFPGDAAPDLSFNGTFTRASSTDNAAPVGAELASLLLGVPAGNMTRSASYAEQDRYFAFYVHDDWKIARNLTLNIGLRYELETPITERYNRSVAGFDFTVVNPISAQAAAEYARSPIPELPVSQFRTLGGVNFVGVGGNSRNYWKGEKNNLLPRFGFAYQMFPKTVIRGGYGIFYNSIGVNQTNSIQAGFSQATPIDASLDNGLTYQATTANPFPRGLIQPLGPAGGLTTNLGQNIQFFNANRLQPYAQRWSMGFQQEVYGGFVIESAYVGNRTTRIAVNKEYNAVPRNLFSTSPVRDQASINFAGAQFNNPFFGLSQVYGRNTSRAQLLRPFPQFNNIEVSEPIGYAWYHSLQSRIEKRFSQGYTLQVSYTFSKAMEAVSFLNPSDVLLHEVISSIDRPHRLTASGIWEIPFGRKRMFGGDSHPAVNFVLGGWQLNGVMQKQSGGPLGFGNRIFNGDMRTVELPEGVRSVDRWLDASGFNRITTQQLGNNIRTMPERFSYVRGPGQSRWDFSAIKNFQMTERFNMEFRAEAFNAMNTPNLANPGTDPTASSFGVITGQDPPRSWQFALKLTF